ncbi:MAG TPA: hypothetical protein VLA43_20995 [Longimicrobiales bacterium]|nr:hypothetical protein [Longimicrobiales bacterium]
MKRSSLLVAAAALMVAACGPAELVVTAEVDVQDPNTGETVNRPVSDLEIQLLPFDRDAIFDSLAMSFGTPEPEVPQDLLDAREEIAAAQQRWRQLENRWNTLRDTLQTITEAMEGLSRGEAQYRILFNEYNEFEGEYGRVERQMETAFNEFDSLQKANLEYGQQIRIQQDNWADEAFAEVDAVWAEKIRAAGLQPAADTTDASGVARFEVPPGEYWIHGRLEEVYTELYWNIPVTVTKGDPVTVTLTRENAQIRTKL